MHVWQNYILYKTYFLKDLSGISWGGVFLYTPHTKRGYYDPRKMSREEGGNNWKKNNQTNREDGTKDSLRLKEFI